MILISMREYLFIIKNTTVPKATNIVQTTRLAFLGIKVKNFNLSS